VNERLSRQKVLDRAVKLARRDGLEALSLTRLAADLGVSQPALYRHIGGMEDLHRALTLRARELLTIDLHEAIEGLSGEEAVRALARTWRRDTLSRRGLLPLSSRVKTQGDAELEASVGGVVSAIGLALLGLDLEEEERVHAARTLRSALHGSSFLEVNARSRSEDFGESFDHIVTMIWIGLQAMSHDRHAGNAVVSRQRAQATQTGAAKAHRTKHLLGGESPANGQGSASASARLTPGDVVDTAARLADAEGIAAVNLTRVAKELGVRQPALYRHVDGIEALLRALALRAREMLSEAITEAAIGRSRDDAVAAVADAWRRFVSAHPGLYSVVYRAVGDEDPDLEAAADRILRVLALSLIGYSLSSEATIRAARSLRTTLHGFCLLEQDGGHPPPYSIDESFDRLVNLLIAGVRGLAAAEVVAVDRKARSGRKR
jgi:AcrR family transcriptional regulator